PPPDARAREPPPRGAALRHRGGGRGTGGLVRLVPASQRRRRLPGGYEKRVLPRVRRRGRGSDPSSERSLNATHASSAPARAAASSPPFTLRHPRTLRETSGRGRATLGRHGPVHAITENVHAPEHPHRAARRRPR